MVEDTNRVLVGSRHYIPLVLKFSQDKDKDLPYVPSPGIGTPTSYTNKEECQRHEVEKIKSIEGQMFSGVEQVTGAPVGQVGVR